MFELDRLAEWEINRILENHGQTGYCLADGQLRLLSVGTKDGVTVTEWVTVKRSELGSWLGY